MRTPVAALFLCAAVSTAALGEPATCPLIRPPGLKPSEVDQIVLAKLALVLDRDEKAIDVRKSVKELQGKSEWTREFRAFHEMVGDALGFDGPALLHVGSRAQ